MKVSRYYGVNVVEWRGYPVGAFCRDCFQAVHVDLDIPRLKWKLPKWWLFQLRGCILMHVRNFHIERLRLA